jgi:dihydropteroate synthase
VTASLILRARDRELQFGARPLLMGIVNTTPDSFSDSGERTLEARVALARQLVDDGAAIIDVGGESNVTNLPAVAPEEEIERVVPVVERVAALGVTVSVDTYKPAVAEAAIAAGAHLVNDVSGLADTALADVCARSGAGLVLVHTPVAPKTQSLDEERYADPAAEVARWLGERIALARSHGVHEEQLLLDPGPDFGKTPAQTVAVLRGLPALHALGRPLLLAVSRKDFLGAITPRRPRDRDPATLAAIGHGADAGAHVLRVHDVRGAADFLAVRAVLRGDEELPPFDRDDDALKWIRASGS